MMSQNVKRIMMVLLTCIVLVSGCMSLKNTQTDNAVKKAGSLALGLWNDGEARDRLISFVESVTTDSSPQYLQKVERIAVFDNDGTLWTEKPTATQIIFALEQVKVMAPQHPEWEKTEPFASILKDGIRSLKKIGLRGAIGALIVTHAQQDFDNYQVSAKNFLQTTHPMAKRPYADTTYKPMVQFMNYLRSKEFKIFIVTGGTSTFVRAFSEEAYDVPRDQVIGSELLFEASEKDGKVTVERKAKIGINNDKTNKIVSIRQGIGRRPVIAVGNSDGDIPMLRYASEGKGPSLAIMVHHDDEIREAAYDKGAEKALGLAEKNNWLVVSVKNDFHTVYGD